MKRHILKIFTDEEGEGDAIISITLPDTLTIDPLEAVPAILSALKGIQPKRKPRKDAGVSRKGATA
jgi:hypothetical protein